MRTFPPQTPKTRAKAVEPVEAIDWLAIWALSLGLCAVVLAAIAFFSIGDKMGASFILAASAGIIGALLHWSAPPAHQQ